MSNPNPVGGIPWSKDEDEILLSMRREGLGYREIAAVLSGRTYASVKMRSYYFRMSPEERTEVNRLKKVRNENRPKRKHVFIHDPGPRLPPVVVPPEVLADRDRRAAAQRTLTAILCGDPEPNRVRL